jgi:hypothetical protein
LPVRIMHPFRQEPVRFKPHAFPFREGPELVQMRRRPGRLQQHRTEMLAVRQMHLQAGRIRDGRSAFGRRSLGHQREVADELAAASEVTGDGEPLKLGPGAVQRGRRVLEEGRSAMQVQPSPAALGDSQVCKIFLQRGAESLRLLDAIFFAAGSSSASEVMPRSL